MVLTFAPNFRSAFPAMFIRDWLQAPLSIDRFLVSVDDRSRSKDLATYLHSNWSDGVLRHGITEVVQERQGKPLAVSTVPSWAKTFPEETICIHEVITFEGGAFEQHSGENAHSGHGPSFCGRKSNRGHRFACHECAAIFPSGAAATEFRRVLYRNLQINASPEPLTQLARDDPINVTVIRRGHEDSQNRHFQNAEELIAALSAATDFPHTTVPARVTVVRMEDLSLKEQVQVMAHSVVTIAAHGAGMVGTYFMRAGKLHNYASPPHRAS